MKEDATTTAIGETGHRGLAQMYAEDQKHEQDDVSIFAKPIDRQAIEGQCAAFEEMPRRASENLELPLVTKRKPIARRDGGDQRPPLKVAGLFAGIGGIELGLARAGHESSLLCEFEPGARAVLETRFPKIRLHSDIRTLSALPRGTELVAAGFPCQDLSQAGKAVGIEGARSSLVGEVFRLLESRRVPWVLLENVPFMLQLARGRAMEVIVAEMERLGYRWAYRVVNSRAFGLPQRRERVLFLASRDEDPRDVLFADEETVPEDPANPLKRLACGFYWTEGIRGLGWAVDAVPTLKGGSTVGIPSAPAIVLPDGRVVTPNICDAERMQGFEPRWTEPAAAAVKEGHRWKLVGNAVTVEVAEWVGKRFRAPSPVGREVTNYPLAQFSAWPRAAYNVDKQGRRGVEISAFPELRRCAPLHEWLQFEPKLLSAKATAGFLSRTEVSSLRFPKGFLEMLREHLRQVEMHPVPARGRRKSAPVEAIA